MFQAVLLLICYFFSVNLTRLSDDLKCNIRAKIESGWVCGLVREAELGVEYASFRGIPYGQQPLGKLRFQELLPVKHWPHLLDATEEGPVCPQHDEVYGNLVKPIRGMSEACIYVNVHVPIEALPKLIRDDEFEYNSSNPNQYETNKYGEPGYPIFVFIHGGGFNSGSGNSDLHGPEYLVSKGFIVISFNYRLGLFGFLSLNTAKIPGNAGLRDQVTLLNWVQRNALAFGGDPHDVTIAGQSAGATNAHLLALSKVTKGLFKRVVIMSGTAIPAFYTSSPMYAAIAAAGFLKTLGVNTTDPDLIHEQLINTPLEDIINAVSIFQYESGFISFAPVVERKYPGVISVVDDDPIRLIERGRDKEYPMIVGFANNECEFFRYRVKYLKMLRRIKENPTLVLPAGLPFSTPPNVSLYLAKKVIKKYFHERLNYDDYLIECRDTLFEYPAFQLVRWRGEMNAAPSYLYQFQYESDFSAVKTGLSMRYKGSAHVDDLTYIFRENEMLGDEKSFPPKNRDDHMKDWMTMFIVNFMRCNDPSCGRGWPPVHPRILNYQSVYQPGQYINTLPTPEEWDMIHFYDKIYEIARNSSAVGALSFQGQSPPNNVT